MPAERRRPGLVLGILSLAAFMASLDLFIVNVAFDAISHDFHGSGLDNVSWVLNGYAIVYAALLIPLGRLADRFGRKAGFMIGLAVFTTASAACAVSPTLWLLVTFRVLQAAGAAALTPTSLGLLLAATAPARRARAVRIWAATGALAAAAGPVVGGVLVTGSWRLVFLVNVPIGIGALVGAARFVPDSRDDTASPRLPDLVGAVVLAFTIGVLALGLVRGTSWGWAGARTVTCFALALAGLLVFVWRSAHHPSPVVEPSLLRVRTFAWSNAASLVFAVAFTANLLQSILWMQTVWHFTPIETGLAVAPGPLMVPPFNALAGWLSPRIGPGRVAALGCLSLASGVLVIQLLIGQTPDYVGEMLPGQLLVGAGVGLALPTILSSATVDLPHQRTATGSAVVNMSRQIGSVIGVSVLVALLGTPVGFHAAYDAFEHARFTIAFAAVIAAGAALGMTPRPASPALAVREEPMMPVAGD